jgi:HAD superfamily hydrolase (TIGR01509 family)
LWKRPRACLCEGDRDVPWNHWRRTSGKMTIAGLIFDFDGLILDTEMPRFRAWERVYREYGCMLDLDEYAGILGRPDSSNILLKRNLEACSSAPVDWEYADALRSGVRNGLLEKETSRPGVVEYLLEAKGLGLKTAIASSSPLPWVAGHLGRLGLAEEFRHLATIEEVQYGKPAPDLYLLALEKMGCSAEKALAFEDSPNGCLAARGAGIACVYVPHPLVGGVEFKEYDYTMGSLLEMPLAVLLDLHGRRRGG